MPGLFSTKGFSRLLKKLLRVRKNVVLHKIFGLEAARGDDLLGRVLK